MNTIRNISGGGGGGEWEGATTCSLEYSVESLVSICLVLIIWARDGQCSIISAPSLVILPLSSTVIAIRGKDGVVFGVEKLVTSKLHEPDSNKRIFTVDKHVGMVGGERGRGRGRWTVGCACMPVCLHDGLLRVVRHLS